MNNKSTEIEMINDACMTLREKNEEFTTSDNPTDFMYTYLVGTNNGMKHTTEVKQNLKYLNSQDNSTKLKSSLTRGSKQQRKSEFKMTNNTTNMNDNKKYDKHNQQQQHYKRKNSIC